MQRKEDQPRRQAGHQRAIGRIALLARDAGRHAKIFDERDLRANRSLDVLANLSSRFGPALTTVYSTRAAVEQYVLEADLVIGAVLVPGAAAPKLVTADHVRRMKPGSVVVDVAIDQGGCFETSRPTPHTDPTYVVDEVVH